MKKTLKSITIILGLCLIFASLFSCDDIVGLGNKLDINGPVITITDPLPRAPIKSDFVITGTATDKTGVSKLLVKIVLEKDELSRQWRYYNKEWQITDNSGVTWVSYSGINDTLWDGDAKNAVWSVDASLISAADGEYTIVVQAWDVGDFTDDNSYKTRAVRIDTSNPAVEVTEPYLEKVSGTKNKVPTTGNFAATVTDTSEAVMRDHQNIGKFISRSFNLQYQIDDNSDVYSVEIRLYDNDAIGTIDEDHDTPLPANYIFKYNDKEGAPDGIPGSSIKPNGNIKVPPLDSADVYNPISKKTNVVVVALCYDAAGNKNDELILGSFIYWPKADNPWIEFANGMKPAQGQPGGYTSEADVYMVYPGRESTAYAFQPYGVPKVEYSIWKLTAWNGTKSELKQNNIVKEAAQPLPGTFAPTFKWTFAPPSSTGYYIIEAKVYGKDKTTAGDGPTATYSAVFFVQDVSFPDFIEAPSPSASKPLFESMAKPDSFGTAVAANKIRISGRVDDATEVKSVYLVWINPESKNFAAMSQLAYFRDGEYEGWTKADAITLTGNPTYPGTVSTNFIEEGLYDPDHKNKVWKVPIIREGKDPVSEREIYRYSQLIDITNELNIAGTAAGKDKALKSQIFLLRVKNDSGKSTVITYAPQGDESPPTIPYQNENGKDFQIKVTTSAGANSKTCYSGHYELIEQFADGNTITVDCRWQEDSIGFLNFQTYLRDNIEISINGTKVSGQAGTNTTLTYTPNTGTGFTTGTIRAVVTLGSTSAFQFQSKNVKDTLVVSIKIKDIGGNITEAGGSWLIRSDTLKLLRISSEVADTKYRATGTPIKIFLEFNKPVQLTQTTNGNTNYNLPSLQLNVTGGTEASRRATYSSGQLGIQSTRQYFDYTVTAGHAANPVLDVTGLVGVSGTNYWTDTNYAFSWISGSGSDAEYIKVTLPTETAHADTSNAREGTGNRAYLRRLPIYSTTADEVYSLRGGKSIEIDTAAPTVTSITSTSPAGFYSTDSDVFIEVTFNEPVQVTGTPTLALQFRDPNNNNTTLTKNTNGSVKVNGEKISFSYNVKTGDTTGGNPLIVTTFAGTITDIAGNALANTGISSLAAANRTLNGTTDALIRGVEANNPGVPTVKILTAGTNTFQNNTTNVVVNNVGTGNGTNINGYSTGTGSDAWTTTSPTPVALSTLYNTNLWIAIDANIPTGQTQKFSALEYSLNNGKDWTRAATITNNQYFLMALPRPGDYQVTARQIDKAGNVSRWTQPVTFTHDPGTLITNITSTSANGTYTHNTDRNKVNISINFRKPLSFTAAAAPVINATTATGVVVLDTTPNQLTGTRQTLTYTYTVASGHTTGANNLAVSSLGAFTVRDATNVNVSSYITMPTGDALLQNNKAIVINTNPLNITAGPTFSGGTVQDDGSWTGTMTMTFNNNISKGNGTIRIEQVAGTNNDTYYRLPAVITEAQYNRLRSVARIDSFYTRGTNGYKADTQSSDTSTKYILGYANNTANLAPSSTSALGTLARLADDMRKAEAVEINIYAQAVTINNNTLTVTLSGSNALPVAGASYSVTYAAGLVGDDLGNTLAARTDLTAGIATTGVARPFVRIQRSQDTINSNGSTTTVTAGTATRATYSATQPLTSAARMDCRTPGSTIVYRYLETRTSVTALNWAQAGPNDSLTAGNPNPNNIGDPATTTTGNYGTFTGTTTPITMPITTAAQTEYQGYQCLIRAKGRSGNNYSAASDEIAYRTVLTYQIRNMQNDGSWTQTMQRRDNDTTGTQTLGAQVWIRGGDAIGTSTTPGFPLTWGDDWTALSGKRAGIRLLSLPTAPANGMDAASEWKFVSWEINVPAYFDIIKGYSTTNDSCALIWQYGPREIAYQRAGWTSFKEQYPMFPGKHRWLYVDGSDSFANKGRVNFSNTFSQRRTFTANEGWTGVNTAGATPSGQ